jgi:hypothetical protein
MTAFVLGNGISRSPIDPAQLIQLHPVYGCNALYRTFTPTVLVATDQPISTAIQQDGYSQSNRFYTRRPDPTSGAQRVPQKYFGFSSGPIAVALAALDGHSRIYLLGFDMGPTTTGRFNNMFADTEFYKTSQSTPTYSGNWVKQMASVTRDFPDFDFIRVHGDTTAEISDFASIKNLHRLAFADFVERINTQKDL